jgi:cytidine deaminase
METEKETRLLQAATEVREHAYAPYSGFKVGAALISSATGALYRGCNVENASYGATICAERNAVLQAVAAEGQISIDTLLVVTDAKPAAVPCAQCLQVLSEFCNAECKILLATLSGIVKSYRFDELLPHPFNKIPEQ